MNKTSQFIFLLLVWSTIGCQSTRPAHLGKSVDQLTPCPTSANCVSSLASEVSEHYVLPFSKVSMKQLETRIRELANAKIIVVSDHYLYAEFTSSVFKFVDDFELLKSENGTSVQVKSVSRLGSSDFGVNRKRVEYIRGLLE